MKAVVAMFGASLVGLLLFGAVVLLLAGCATSQEWQTWREHPTHFASWEHLTYSATHHAIPRWPIAYGCTTPVIGTRCSPIYTDRLEPSRDDWWGALAR